VIDIEDVPDLVDPVVIAAFEGWNDAADAASGVVDHLMKVWQARVVGAIDPEEFYDFQVNRPMVGSDAHGHRRITWPGTQIAVASPRDLHRDIILLRGIEPNMRWRSFCDELIELIQELGASTVVALGALLADTPHTRPTPVTGSAYDAESAANWGLETSTYQGPTGILGVFQDACVQAGLPAVSFWAAVPHYVSQARVPKAAVALLHRVEEVLDVEVPLGALPEQAEEWERTVSEMAEADDEVREYVRQLEEQAEEEEQATELPEASGDEIAADFERYLRRRGTGGPGDA
jgi:predicted ATP-grasp superfamily ATP-dependent carboligase